MTALYRCALCGAPLSGGSDTYGDYDDPLCRSCYIGNFDPRERQVTITQEPDKSWLVEQQRVLDTLADCVRGKGWSVIE